MQTLARLIAAERKLPSADYRDVLRALKQETIPNDKLLATYQARLATVEDIIRREKIVSLPQRAAVIRLGSEAESASIPAPHISPPQLIGNTGQNAEFVLPLDNPNATPGAKMDDFTYDAITWPLTVHEARPGHELQFARMIEAGVSIPRAVFAFKACTGKLEDRFGLKEVSSINSNDMKPAPTGRPGEWDVKFTADLTEKPSGRVTRYTGVCHVRRDKPTTLDATFVKEIRPATDTVRRINPAG